MRKQRESREISHRAGGFSGQQPGRYCHVTRDNWQVNCISFTRVRLSIYNVCIFQHKQRGFGSLSFLPIHFQQIKYTYRKGKLAHTRRIRCGQTLQNEGNDETGKMKRLVVSVFFYLFVSLSGLSLQIHPVGFLSFQSHTHIQAAWAQAQTLK